MRIIRLINGGVAIGLLLGCWMVWQQLGSQSSDAVSWVLVGELTVFLYGLRMFRLAEFSPHGQQAVSVSIEYAPLYLLAWFVAAPTLLWSIAGAALLQMALNVLLIYRGRQQSPSLWVQWFVRMQGLQMASLTQPLTWQRSAGIVLTASRQMVSAIVILTVFHTVPVFALRFHSHMPLWSLTAAATISSGIILLSLGLSVLDLWAVSLVMPAGRFGAMIKHPAFRTMTLANVLMELVIWFVGVPFVLLLKFSGLILWGSSVIGLAWLVRSHLSRQEMAQRLQLEEEAARTDFLTRLPTRRAGEEYLQQLATRHYRTVIGMIDVDWFKKVNDTQGHEVGDRTLKALARFWETRCRQRAGPYTDMIVRWGGEEFVLILPQMPDTVVPHRLETIRTTLSQPIQLPDGR
ncbi:MAG: hypothetical protein C7B44_05120, partial [Sulfobacillus thermosulfidooxidans]